MSPTPEQQRNIEKQQASFAKSWYLDLETIEIRRKKSKWWQYPIELIWKRKNSVFSMYWFLKKERLENEKTKGFDFPLKQDKMPIEGQPTKYQLREIWNIPKKDLKYLSGGPLIDCDSNLLVPPDFNFRNSSQNVIPLLKILGAIIILVGTIIKYWP